MMRPVVFVVATALFAAFARPLLGDVDVHVNIGVPPPPVVTFTTEPELVVIPRTQVYYVPVVTDYDMFRYGRYWYVSHGGHWYRSRGYRGPFKVVAHNHLPRAIVALPGDFRHRHVHGDAPLPKHDKHRHHRKAHSHDDDD